MVAFRHALKCWQRNVTKAPLALGHGGCLVNCGISVQVFHLLAGDWCLLHQKVAE